MTWTQLGNDMVNDGTASSLGWGNSGVISGDGTTVVIGSPYTSAVSSNRGGCIIFKYNSVTSAWIQKQLINGDNTNDYFGTSVAVSYDGGVIAIGAPQTVPDLSEPATSLKGYVKIYKYNTETTVWETISTTPLTDTDSSSRFFGYAVAISDDGSNLIVGAPGTFIGSNQLVGKIVLYNLVNSVSPQEIFGENFSNRFFGSSVAMSGDGMTVIAGSKKSNANTYPILKYDSNQKLWVNTETISDIRGYASFALSKDGGRLIIGNPFANSVAVYVYESSRYYETANFYHPSFTYYGISVGISDNGNTIAIGSQNAGTSTIGSVHILHLTNSGNINTPEFIESQSTVNNNYGTFVDISSDGERVAVTEGRMYNTTQGAVRVYVPPTTTTTVAPTTTTPPTGGCCSWFNCCSN